MDGSSFAPKNSATVAASQVARPDQHWSGFVKLQLIFWGGFFALRAFAAITVYPQYFWGYMTPRIAVVALYALATTLLHLLASRFPAWSPAQRLWLVLGAGALALYPMHLFEASLTHRFAPDWPSTKFLDYMSSYGWVLLAWAGYYYALDHARELRRQTKALTQAQALAHDAQIKMLRYQLNPHFLFNSLNAISTLVLDGRNKDAEGMLLRLSRFLRHTIDTDPTQLARLGDEAHVQRLYLEMEAVRFGERLRVDCDVPVELHDCLVPTMLLQPIVENAIKHGVSRSAAGGRISIKAEAADGRLLLSVANDGPPFSAPLGKRGLGLKNAHDRLRAIYGADARLSVSTAAAGGAQVVFDLPLARLEDVPARSH